MKITHLTGKEVIELANKTRVKGVFERKWAFVKTANGRMMLSPTTGPHYLYRGQTQRHTPCFPVIYRHLKRPARFLHQLSEDEAISIVANIARTFLYYSELDRHPFIRWAKAQRVDVSELEIAQHYGIPSSLLDVSESVEVALFFATHDYHEGSGFRPRTSGTGVLYIVNRVKLPQPFAQRFSPVAIQPFPRPFRQWAWTCELFMGECFEECPWLACIEFEHSSTLADEIRGLAEVEGELFPQDPLANLAEAVNALRTLPVKAVKSAADHLGAAYPHHRFGNMMEALRRAGYYVVPEVEPIYGPDLWAKWEAQKQTEFRQWKSFASSRIERLAVRGGRRKGDPLQWSIDGKLTDRFWSPSSAGQTPRGQHKIVLPDKMLGTYEASNE